MTRSGVRWERLIAVGLALGVGGREARAQDPAALMGATAVLYTNITVIDGRGGAPRPDEAILVWSGRIQAVGARARMSVPQGTTVVDLEGAWVVPGYIDAHATALDSATLSAMFAAGITGVREASVPLDALDGRGHIRGLGDAEPRPRLYLGGPILDTGEGAIGLIVDDPEEAPETVRRLAEEYEAGFVAVSARVPAEWMPLIARAARHRDLSVWAEGAGPGWLLRLRAGADVVTHLLSGDPDLLPEGERDGYRAVLRGSPRAALVAWLARLDPEGPELDRAIGALLSRDAAVVPLLAASSRIRNPALDSAWPVAGALVRRLDREGVRLLIGSDTPRSGDPGVAFHRELQAMVDAGIPPVDVIAMATRNGAIALGVLHERGTIEMGKRADFLVLDYDPTVRMDNAGRISLIVQDGRAWRPLEGGGFERIRFR